MTVGEDTKTFEEPSDAEKFLMATVPNWKHTKGDNGGTSHAPVQKAIGSAETLQSERSYGS